MAAGPEVPPVVVSKNTMFKKRDKKHVKSCRTRIKQEPSYLPAYLDLAKHFAFKEDTTNLNQILDEGINYFPSEYIFTHLKNVNRHAALLKDELYPEKRAAVYTAPPPAKSRTQGGGTRRRAKTKKSGSNTERSSTSDLVLPSIVTTQLSDRHSFMLNAMGQLTDQSVRLTSNLIRQQAERELEAQEKERHRLVAAHLLGQKGKKWKPRKVEIVKRPKTPPRQPKPRVPHFEGLKPLRKFDAPKPIKKKVPRVTIEKYKPPPLKQKKKKEPKAKAKPKAKPTPKPPAQPNQKPPTPLRKATPPKAVPQPKAPSPTPPPPQPKAPSPSPPPTQPKAPSPKPAPAKDPDDDDDYGDDDYADDFASPRAESLFNSVKDDDKTEKKPDPKAEKKDDDGDDYGDDDYDDDF